MQLTEVNKVAKTIFHEAFHGFLALHFGKSGMDIQEDIIEEDLDGVQSPHNKIVDELLDLRKQ